MPHTAYITPQDLDRFHAAARSIWNDMDEAYFSVREKYGADVAGVVLVTLLREKLNDKPGQYPPPADLTERVNERLRAVGLVE